MMLNTSSIELAPQQIEAATKIHLQYRLWHSDTAFIHRQPYFFLSGFAGTGKTTILKQLFSVSHPQIATIPLPIPAIKAFRDAEKAYRTQEPSKFNPRRPPPSYPVSFAAYTAKAAQVMQSKHIPATTIHGMLYTLILPDPNLIEQLEYELTQATVAQNHAEIQILTTKLQEASKPHFEYLPPSDPRSRLRNTKLIVLDECSMIGTDLWQDLLSTGIPMLILGDLGQLGPVKSEAAPFLAHPPHFQLTEIHRQALDNPILLWATHAREQAIYKIPYTIIKGKASRFTSHDFIDNANHIQHLNWFDQIIVATHNRRKHLNGLARQILYSTRTPPIFPQPNEKLICGKNDHKNQIYNGVMYRVTSIDENSYEDCAQTQTAAFDQQQSVDDYLLVNKTARRNLKLSIVPYDPDPFTNDPDQEPIPTEITIPMRPFLPSTVPSNDFIFDYGYAITVHKSQGSEWGKVLLWNEKTHPTKQSLQDYSRWLYTGITRASETVVIVG